jgi:threonyl-tRNA synthetase
MKFFFAFFLSFLASSNSHEFLVVDPLSRLLTLCTGANIEAEVNKIVKQKQKFERLVITKDEGLDLFADNPFKLQIISTKVPDGGRTTVYRCGDLIDLCRGPHLAHTGKVKAFAATRHSATNWLGDTENDSLQRMYGISFPDKKQLKIWQENQEKVRAYISTNDKEQEIERKRENEQVKCVREQ